jgi:hypothetical protein
MSRKARSARGKVVDFDLLAIKQQLATRPVPVAVDQRRKFIDEKDGIKVREVVQIPPSPATATTVSALSVGIDAAAASASAAKKHKKTDSAE